MGTTMWKAAASAACLVVIPAALAQQAGIVTIEVTNVTVDIARNIGVDASRMPLTVQVPVEVAAKVCGLGAEILAREAASGSANCVANATSNELDEAMRLQVKGPASQ